MTQTVTNMAMRTAELVEAVRPMVRARQAVALRGVHGAGPSESCSNRISSGLHSWCYWLRY